MRSSLASSRGISATTRPPAITRIRSASPSSSGISEEITSKRDSFPRKLGDEAIDFGLGADIDAARGFIEDQHFRTAREPTPKHDLLLIAPGQIGHRCVEAWRPDAKPVDERARDPPLGAVIDEVQIG